MDENLSSMGDTGKTDFKEEVINQDNTTVVESEPEQKDPEKTVEDVIKEKEQNEQLAKEKAIAEERENEANKKIAEQFGYRWQDEEPVKKEEVIEKEVEVGISDDDKALIEKAKQAVEATKRVTKFYEEKHNTLLSENKELKTTQLELEYENKSLRAKIEEMANENARKSNNYIETDDNRLRYVANLRKRRKENPEDVTLKAKEIDYLIDELSILTPHVTPEAIRQVITKKDDVIEINSWGKTDYIKEADAIVKKTASENNKAAVLRAIQPRKTNYNI